MSENPRLAALRSIGWQGELPAGSLARVVAQHRAGYEVHDGGKVFPAQPGAEFLRPGLEPEQRPAVGDFVSLHLGDPPEIRTIMPRRSLLVRAAAGERYKRQVIATNIDSVWILTGLDGDFNPQRIERYLALVAGSRIQPVVLLTKLDKVADSEVRSAALRRRLPQDIPVLAINAKSADCRAMLDAWLKPGSTVALVGSSGAGKSTLTNTLLGEVRMSTGAVRARDSRGRHTTTHRALLPLPGGACLIDTPGMRELKLTGEETLDSFDDIEELALRCRFNDCSHRGEPGCALQAAIAAGQLDAARLCSYSKLHAERRQQADQRDARQQRKNDARSPAAKAGRTSRNRHREEP